MITGAKSYLGATFILAGMLSAAPAIAAPDLTGTTITAAWKFPTSTTTYLSQDVVVGPGTEISCAGGGAGGGLCPGFIDAATIDIGSNTLTLTITDGNASWTGSDFNGYVFSGLSAGGSWTGYSLSTTFSGLDASRISFTPDVLSVNMQGILPSAGQSFTITLLNRAVPEPSSWAMMIGGFGLVGGALRHRRKTAFHLA